MVKPKHSLNYYRCVYIDGLKHSNRDGWNQTKSLEAWEDFSSFIDYMQNIAVERYKRENNINE